MRAMYADSSYSRTSRFFPGYYNAPCRENQQFFLPKEENGSGLKGGKAGQTSSIK